MDKFILIDGNSLLYRAFYAMPPLNTKNGVYTNAVLGFATMLLKVIEEHNPKYMTVAFDMHGPTFRHDFYSDYKATRKPMPDELVSQLPIVKKMLKLMNITILEKQGSEADDIIGTLSKRHFCNTYIITGDKDALQLVDECTSVLFTRRGISEIDIYSADNFTEKTGLVPSQIIDLKALMGDASDNIPGIKGIGEKTAMSLLYEFQTVENVLNNADKLKGALKEKISGGVDAAMLSKNLATIDINIEINVEKENLLFDFPFSEQVRELFTELEFRRLLSKDIFANTSGENLPVKIIFTDSLDFLSGREKEIFSINLGESLSVSFGDRTEYTVKIKNSFFDEGMDFENLLNALKPVLENTESKIIVFNKKALQHKLREFGIELLAFTEDVSIKKYLADFAGRDEQLENIIAEKGLDKESIAHSLYQLNDMFDEMLKENEMFDLYYKLELPLSDVLFDMEITGFKIDERVLIEFRDKYDAQLKILTEKIYDLAGEEFNINSPKQLGIVLFEKLKLTGGKKTKTGYSTNIEVLESVINQHLIVPLIIEYRHKQKLLSTYIEGFLPLIDRRTGLVHTSFNQLVTTTGRLSSKEPNLQNIPVRDDEGKEIRRFFIASGEENRLVAADYSQIELRLLAHFSRSKKLIEAFQGGGDIHALTASEVFGVPLKAVDVNMRRDAKAVNFGIIYGISDFGLAQNLKISRTKAAQYIARYFERYPEIKEYMDGNVEFAKKYGYVTTLLGRRRVISELLSPSYTVRSFGERAAMNMPLQGSSADIIKIAMLEVYNRLKTEKLKTKLILQVHDELILDAPLSEVETAKKILKEEMENAVKLSVPLTVDVSSGKSWFDTK